MARRPTHLSIRKIVVIAVLAIIAPSLVLTLVGLKLTLDLKRQLERSLAAQYSAAARAKVREVEAEALDAETGMGGIRFNDCNFDKVYAETGMGSIRLKDTSYKDSDFDTGLGSVKFH